MMQNNNKHIAVLGAGMVGVATAIWLQRSGHKVTLVDREGVAAGASYGNAGILACSGIIPVSKPGLIFKAPLMLLNPDQPLFLRWSYLPKIMPWLFKFLSRANLKDMISSTHNLYQLMYDSVDQHRALAAGTGAEKFIKATGWLHGYASQKEFDKDKLYWKILREIGLDLVEMSPDEITEFDPALKDKFGYGILSKSDGQITDPGEYIKTLAAHFEKQGGVIKIGEVIDIKITEKATPKIVFANADEALFDSAVITAGAHSGQLTEKLGLKVPLESERGYHLEFTNANIKLNSPVMVTSGKFGMNSMNGRLRCAGVVELGGLEAKPSRAPFELLKRKVAELFPELEYDEVHEWMGHRPSTPDALPLIGVLGKNPNVWAGFGHQHLGITGGPRTGKWLAQMISGKKINEDISAFDPSRF